MTKAAAAFVFEDNKLIILNGHVKDTVRSFLQA